MKKILVVIDMQNDFIDGPLGTPEARAIVPNVCAKIREGEWDKMYATKDFHNVPEYHDSQEGKKLPIVHCLERTEGYGLNVDVSSALYNSGSYPFTVDKSTFGSLDLPEYIKMDCDLWFGWERGAERNLEIHMVGVCTDICVITNALLLKTHFPEARIVVDASCCAGTIQLKHQKALDVMRSCQIDILNESESAGLSD